MKIITISVICVSLFFVGCAEKSYKNIPYHSLKHYKSKKYNSVFFGDSLVDSSNVTASPVLPNNYLPPITANNYWIPYYYYNYYQTPNNAQYNGRLHGAPITSLSTNFMKDKNKANRPTWVNYFLQSTNQNNPSLYTYRYLKTTKNSVDIYHSNISMAYASAETGSHYVSDLSITQLYSPYVTCQNPGVVSLNKRSYSCVPGVITQIKLYDQLLAAKKDSMPNLQTRYFIWAGANDITNNIAKLLLMSTKTSGKNQGFNFKEFKNYEKEYIKNQKDCKKGYFTIGKYQFSCPARNMREAVEKLESSFETFASPRRIYVLNLPNLAETPKMQAMAWSVAMSSTLRGRKEKIAIYKSILGIVSEISKNYNARLEEELATPSKQYDEVLPKSHIYPTDKALNELITNPKKYHFIVHKNKLTHGIASCIGNEAIEVKPDYWISSKHREPAPNACYSQIFYNSVHPSNHTHYCIALGLITYMSTGGKSYLPNNC